MHEAGGLDPVAAVLAIAQARVAEKGPLLGETLAHDLSPEADKESTAPPSPTPFAASHVSSEGGSESSSWHRAIEDTIPALVEPTLALGAEDASSTRSLSLEARPNPVETGRRVRAVARAGRRAGGQRPLERSPPAPAPEASTRAAGVSVAGRRHGSRCRELGKGLPTGGQYAPSLLGPGMQLGSMVEEPPPPPPPRPLAAARQRAAPASASSLAAQLALHASITRAAASPPDGAELPASLPGT